MAKLEIGVKTGAGKVFIETDDLPQEVYEAALLLGLKELCHKGMSKVTKANIPDDDARKAETLRIATENAAELVKKDGDGRYIGKVKLDNKRAGPKVSGEVKTEAMRLARNLAKDEIKKAGIKVSHVAASEITAAAKAYLEAIPALLEQAAKNVADRKAKPEEAAKLDIKSLIKVDPKLVAASEAKKAKAKKKDGETLSATQAGAVAQRAKGGAKPQAGAKAN